MTDRRKVIHVKDLVIKADNVFIEPTRPRPRRDPFFGGPRVAPVQEESKEHDVYEEKHESLDERESSDEDKKDDRRPFSWI